MTRAVQMSRDRTPKLADEGVMQLIRNDSDLDRVKKAQLIRHFERHERRFVHLGVHSFPSRAVALAPMSCSR